MSSVSHDTMIRMLSLGKPPKLEHGPDYDAVFGPFEFEGKEYFKYYDGSIYVWLIGKTRSLAERTFLPMPVVEDGDVRADIAALNALAFLPPPSVPEDLTHPAFRGPFWHGERQFIWIITDKETGWQLSISRAAPAAPKGPGFIVAAEVDA